ncbi:MAG: esterase [Flavobacteriales bacterium]|jgi:esterase
MGEVHYQIYSDSSDKPWLLLIHGLFGNLDNLSALRRQFTESFQVLSIDLPDHGKSAFTQSFSFVQYAKLIFELVNTLDITRLSIVGHSLGGKVAMQLALSQHELISHLIVLDIAPVDYTTRHTHVFQGLNNVVLAELTSRIEANIALSKYVEDSSTRQFLLKSLYNENSIWKWRFNLLLLQKDYAKLSAAIISLQTFLKPVLFIKGEHSDYLLPEHKPAVMKLFPNSHSKIISDTGHWLHAEKPDLCAKIILSFLRKNKSTAN